MSTGKSAGGKRQPGAVRARDRDEVAEPEYGGIVVVWPDPSPLGAWWRRVRAGHPAT